MHAHGLELANLEFKVGEAKDLDIKIQNRKNVRLNRAIMEAQHEACDGRNSTIQLLTFETTVLFRDRGMISQSCLPLHGAHIEPSSDLSSLFSIKSRILEGCEGCTFFMQWLRWKSWTKIASKDARSGAYCKCLKFVNFMSGQISAPASVSSGGSPLPSCV